MKNIKKRNSIKNNFENVYLRSNILQKYLKKTDPSLFKDQNFNKIVSYLTKKHFLRSKRLFTMNGFEIEDINSIIKVYAIVYWSHCKIKTRTKKDYLIMIRYVNQRMINFTKWVAKKFNVSDVSVVSIDPASQILKKEFAQDFESSSVDLEDIKNDNFIKKRNKNKTLIPRMLKNKFYENPLKYEKDLCYYATTKYVSSDVRKKARNICKKYNINYAEWLKNESKKMDFDFSNFTY